MKTSVGTLSSLSAALLACTIIGCGDEPVDPADGDAGGGGSTAVAQGGAGSGGAPDGGAGSGGAPAPSMVQTMSGDITWDVTFDQAALDAGATNCSYTRHYEAVEDQSAKWLCPACEVMFLADVAMTAGEADCFSQISPGVAPLDSEWLGYGNGTWYRGIGGPMSEQGTVTIESSSVTTVNTIADLEAPAGGFFGFGVNGALTLGTAEGDPLAGFVVPEAYACGWPKSDAPAYDGDYTVVVGDTVPDGIFKDKCEETVRLHDFKGAYLIIDMAARDCPPCQSMAGDEEAFVTDMAAQGVTVHIITLLAPSLSDTLGHTTTTMLENWTNNFDLASPVLADRGWGLSAFVPIFGVDTGYPSWVLVDPDLKVMETGNGYGGFADFQTAILADAGL